MLMGSWVGGVALTFLLQPAGRDAKPLPHRVVSRGVAILAIAAPLTSN